MRVNGSREAPRQKLRAVMAECRCADHEDYERDAHQALLHATISSAPVEPTITPNIHATRRVGLRRAAHTESNSAKPKRPSGHIKRWRGTGTTRTDI
jgi:hypothetical protein